MDKNTITGFILIAAILIVFSWWNQPSEEQVAELRKQDSIAAVEKQKAEQASKAKAEAEKQARKAEGYSKKKSEKKDEGKNKKKKGGRK